MPIDTSIYGNLLAKPPSLMDDVNTLDAGDLQRTQLAGAKLNLIGQQQSLADQQAVRALYQRPGFDPSTPQGMADLSAASPTQALATRKAILDNAQTQANTSKATAEAGKATADTATSQYNLGRQKLDRAMQLVSQSATPDVAKQHLSDLVNDGLMTMQDAASKSNEIDQNSATPQAWQQWRLSSMASLMSAHDQFEANKPTLGTRNTGGTIQNTATNPMTGVPTVTATTALTASPDAQLQANTSTSNNRANIAKDYAVAGLNPDGTSTGDVQTMAQMIADGKLPPLSGFALARPRGQQIMATVSQINPDYDATSYGAKQKAARDFTTGTQGNALRSFAVAGQHLDQLGTLVDALDNGQYPIVNKIANAYAQQTGSTAPTNFDAAKDVVSKEVTKAIVAGGGGVSERAELANLMSNAKTPQQLKGVITQYRGLMSAQHDALLQQRRAAGLPDSTLPDYGGTGAPTATPAAPSGFTITHVDGQPQ